MTLEKFAEAVALSERIEDADKALNSTIELLKAAEHGGVSITIFRDGFHHYAHLARQDIKNEFGDKNPDALSYDYLTTLRAYYESLLVNLRNQFDKL